MSALVALVVVVAALAACLLPLAGGSAPAEEDPLAGLEAERDRLVAAIRDVDLDVAMGKVSAEDHRELRRDLEARAVALLGEIERGRGSGAA